MSNQANWSRIGVIYALLLLLFTAFYTLYIRFATQLYNIDVTIFTGISLIVSAFIMMLIAGPGRLGQETLRSPATWFYAILLIATYIFDFLLVEVVSATEATLIYNIAVPSSLMVAYLWLNRTPSKKDIHGAIFIIAGLVIILGIQPVHLFWTVLLLGIGTDIADTARLFIAETHRESHIANEHGGLKDKARVMGFVTFIASLLFLIFIFIFSLLKHNGSLSPFMSSYVPDIHMFADAPTIFSAIIFGITVLALIRYLMWSAVYNLKSESVSIILTFLPVLTFLLEWPINFLLPESAIENPFAGERGLWVLAATALMSIGAGIATQDKLRQMKAEKKKPAAELRKQLLRGEDHALAAGYQPTAPDDYEAASATVEQCSGDVNLAARLLEVPVSALEAVLAGEGRQAFHPTVAARVARNFRHNVALADPLTGLQNRLNFMNALRPLLKTKKPLALLFIDLNKFKPVNDTYGHEAGDVVLKTIAQRLLNTAPHGSLVARLGGDEFVITLASNHIKNAPQIAQSIRAAIQEPILLTSDLPPVELDAAIGKALFPNDAKTPEDLIKAADKNMYKLKKAR